MADTIMTLLEAAKLMEPTKARGVIQTYAEASQILQRASVVPSGTYFKWALEGRLPWSGTTGVRAINSDFDATQATVQEYASETRAYGGKIKVDDKIYVENPESVAYQESAQVRALSRQFSIDVIEASGGSSVTGVRSILENYEDFNKQTVAAASSNNADITLDMLDDVLAKVNVTPTTAIYANQLQIRRINALSRANVSGNMGVSRGFDQFGMYSGMYNGIPLISMLDGRGANMLSVTEADADANETDCSSLWVITWGSEMCTLHSSNSGNIGGVPIPAVKTGLTDGSNFKYSRLDWYVGLACQSIRSVGRIRYLTSV